LIVIDGIVTDFSTTSIIAFGALLTTFHMKGLVDHFPYEIFELFDFYVFKLCKGKESLTMFCKILVKIITYQQYLNPILCDYVSTCPLK
jgi:hypothetical protein